jgi:hypothetical protein
VIGRIEAHNRLNGYRFVIGEFALIGAVVGAFGIYYALHGAVVLGIVALGIVANSAVVIVLCARSLRRGEKSLGIWRIYTEPALRRTVMQEHPNLSTDTLLITAAILVPFAVVIALGWSARH